MQTHEADAAYNATIWLSHVQAQPLLDAHARGQTRAVTSLDLGLSQTEVCFTAAGIQLNAAQCLSWAHLHAIADNANSCYQIEDQSPRKIEAFSHETNRYYSLMPTASAPTMLISGIPMHRIKGTDPRQDTLAKVSTIKPLIGHVLDTATGLGYTALEAATQAEHVTTIELDPTALTIAAQNPWSQRLFDHPAITQLIGDAYDVTLEFADDSLDRVIHDPPMFNLAGHLYSADFYANLRRILRANGRLFHYIGDPSSKSGANTTRGVIRRLQDVGFRRVQRRPRAFGVVAFA